MFHGNTERGWEGERGLPGGRDTDLRPVGQIEVQQT